MAFIPSIKKYALSYGIKTGLVSGDTTIKNSDRGKDKDMDFLKEILGDELYAQVAEKINAHNGNEANKDKQIKVANLGTGEYVGKGKYDSLAEQLTGKQTELDTANSLIAQLKKDTKGNEKLQGKITGYEQQVTDLQKQLDETKLKSAIKVALLSENAKDVDYLIYKLNESLKEKGEHLELDENDNIKGWADRVSGLKTQFPDMFPSATAGKDGYKPVGDNRLNQGDNGNEAEPKSLAEALKMQYENKN